MFKIDYIYQVGGPKYSCSLPDKKDANHNIFVIKGRNDQGKSTIMQMVALGLFGLESEDIDKKLKDRMKGLLSSDADKCEFKFSILSKDGQTKLDSMLKNGQIETKVNSSKKGATYIEDHYKLIFDVPEEPMNKLGSALKSVEDNLREYYDYSEKYIKNIEEIINKIDSFEEKENKLKEEKELLKQKQKGLKERQKRLEDIEKSLIDLQKGHTIITFTKNYREFERLTLEHKEKEKRIKKLESKGVGGGDKKYNRLKKEFMESLANLKFLINTSEHFEKATIKDHKKNLKKFAEQVNAIMTLQDLDDEKLISWRRFLKFQLNEIDSNELLHKKLVEEDQSQLIKKLVKILEEFIEVDIIIPGTSGKSVKEFIDELEQKDKEIESKISEKLILSKAIDEINEIIKQLDLIAQTKKKIPKKESTDTDEDLESLIEQVKEIIEKMNDLTKLLGEIEDVYNEISDEDKTRYLSSEDLIENEFNESKKKIGPLKEKIKQSEAEIKAKEEFIKEYSKITEPPKYDKKLLETQYEVTSSLLRKLGTWRDSIKSLNLKEMKVEADDEETKKLYSTLADYFADVLKVIYYESKGWKINKVDFINRSYIVEGRPPISFIRIGTGHTALNSLMARLKQNYGGKKKIVLFDEIGLMDKNNVNILLKEIKNQVNSGEVLFALLTKVDDNLEKISFEPITCN